MAEDGLAGGPRTRAQAISFVAGPVLALIVALMPNPEGMGPEAQRVAALAVLMAVWWATEAVPIAATSLLPLAVIPLIGAGSAREAGAPYGDPIVLLLMGGSMLAVGIERWGLHRRLALGALSQIGPSTHFLVFAFMGVTAFLSMWISNTATALMMMPIALSVAAAAGGDRRFTQAMVLGVAYAATIGGVATPIGTPTNLIAMGWINEELGQGVSFGDWVSIGLPAMLLLLPGAWFVVTRGVVANKGGAAAIEEIRTEYKALGPMSAPEVRVLIVFGVVIGLWVCGEYLRNGLGLKGVTDTGIVIAGAIAMMLVPAGRAAPGRALVAWDEAAKIPWAVILLFGGGISLAEAMERTGLAAWIGNQMGVLAGAPALMLAFCVVALVIVLTEFMSNVATITMMLPILGALSTAAGVDPIVLIVPAAIAASCGFMMPAGTGPNAVAFATGQARVSAMMGRGFWVNLLALILMTAVGLWLAPLVLG
jgi:solute carrier family 13 (sodium-dependent dicarboxylate transporter), member 2/3/5